jgi:pimeloyl-ACP methyl ester carboxylesterase
MLSLLLCLFILVNLGLLAVDLLVVLLSFSIYWYEHANSNPAVIKHRFTWSNLRFCLNLFLPELFFNFLTVVVIPFGLYSRKNPPLVRGETPVLLLHGLFDNQASWFWFKGQLKRQGIANIVTMNLSSWHNEEILTELLAKRVDELRHQLGVSRVHLIGHSMGGIIARNYIQLRGGADKVDCFITLGSPHHGSKLAPFSIAPLGKLLQPGSDFLQRLNSAPTPNQVRMTNIYTRHDNMVQPNAHCQLQWGNSVELNGMGHTSLIYRKTSIDATITALKGIVAGQSASSEG